jgi:hypothetical protein
VIVSMLRTYRNCTFAHLSRFVSPVVTKAYCSTVSPFHGQPRECVILIVPHRIFGAISRTLHGSSMAPSYRRSGYWRFMSITAEHSPCAELFLKSPDALASRLHSRGLSSMQLCTGVSRHAQQFERVVKVQR